MSARFANFLMISAALTGCELDQKLQSAQGSNGGTGEPASDEAECPCDAAVSKRAAGSFEAGSIAVWEIGIDWQGAEYCGVEALCVVDELMAGQSFVQGSSDWDCQDNAGEVTCCATNFDPTAPFASYALTLDVELPVELEGQIENCARIDITDNFLENNESCATAEVAPPATYVDLSIEKSVQDPGYFTAGSAGVFLFSVTNNGTGDASAIFVTDELPLGFTMDDQIFGDWFCTGDNASPETVICDYTGILAAGDTEVLELKVQVENPWSYELFAENCADVGHVEDNDIDMENNSSCVSFDIAMAEEICGNCLDDDGDGSVDEDCEYVVDVLFSADDQVTMYVDGTQLATTIGYATSDTITEVVIGGDVPHYVAAYVEDIGGTVAAYKAEIQVDGVQTALTGDSSFVGSFANPGVGWQTDTTNLTDSWTIQTHNAYWNGVPTDLTAIGAEWIWFGGGTGRGGDNYIVHQFQICE
jgi:uncharacterized repeat protein (TIGR01451 family)